jgi:hypothetical protein
VLFPASLAVSSSCRQLANGMGAYADIAAVWNGSGTNAQKRTQALAIKQSYFINAAKVLPWQVPGANITVVALTQVPGGVQLYLTGSLRPGFNNPLVIINPPVLIPDPTGTSTLEERGAKYSDDVVKALTQIIIENAAL